MGEGKKENTVPTICISNMSAMYPLGEKKKLGQQHKVLETEVIIFRNEGLSSV